jgi:hypothetical protein
MIDIVARVSIIASPLTIKPRHKAAFMRFASLKARDHYGSDLTWTGFATAGMAI